MGLRDDQLTEGEQVVMRLRTHPKVLVVAVLWALLLTLVLVVLWWVLRGRESYVVTMWVAGAVALALALWLVGVPVLRWRSERFTITNRRISHRHGILTRHGRDIPLHRVNDIALEKGLLDRMLSCGTLVVSDATEKAGMVLHDIPRVETSHGSSRSTHGSRSCCTPTTTAPTTVSGRRTSLGDAEPARAAAQVRHPAG